jgi:diphosphomevalonate decarboxylase
LFPRIHMVSLFDGGSVAAVTCTAPTNIAVVKYWGKRDVALNLPINSSVSVTLDQSDLRTVTCVAASASWGADRLWLNGTEEDVASNRRLVTVFREMRRLAGEARAGGGGGGGKFSAVPDADAVRFWVRSHNTFPTAAGLASSASGYACLTFALARLLGLEISDEVSAVARQGSGSACRSLFGGFVRWRMGSADDGSDSVSSQVAPAAHWPEMEALIMVASQAKKHTSSTSGMMTSVETSPLLAHRAAHVVPERMAQMEQAYLAQDFGTFAELTMRDSNQFHATCLDTFPPIFYMNDVSRAVANAVHAINAHYGRTVAAYTFDAGPNAVIYVLREDALDVLSLLMLAFPASESQKSGVVAGSDGYLLSSQAEETGKRVAAGVPAAPPAAVAAMRERSDAGQLLQMIHTRVGPGPQVVATEEKWWQEV